MSEKVTNEELLEAITGGFSEQTIYTDKAIEASEGRMTSKIAENIKTSEGRMTTLIEGQDDKIKQIAEVVGSHGERLDSIDEKLDRLTEETNTSERIRTIEVASGVKLEEVFKHVTV